MVYHFLNLEYEVGQEEHMALPWVVGSSAELSSLTAGTHVTPFLMVSV